MEYTYKKEVLRGIVDTHVHAGPCIFEKLSDEIDLSKRMQNAGYQGAVFMSHGINADRIHFVRKEVAGFKAIGGITLNQFVGGLNPQAVAYTIALGGQYVKMGTIHTAHHQRVHGSATYSNIRRIEVTGAPKTVKGVTILDDEERIAPGVYEILDMIAASNIVLLTGHLSPTETRTIIKAAKERGVKKIVITHPDWEIMEFSAENQIEFAKMGAILEKTFEALVQFYGIPSDRSDIRNMAKLIKIVGANKCIMSTDLGSGRAFLDPIEGMRIYIELMKRQDISQEEIDIMTKDNPCWLYDLDN